MGPTGFKIIRICPIKRYFTQGVEFLDDKTLMISSGLYDQSKLTLLKVNMAKCTYEEIFSKDLDSQFFAEGITNANGKLY